MKPTEPVETVQRDLFKARLDQILDMGHPKAVLARVIDWDLLKMRPGFRQARPALANKAYTVLLMRNCAPAGLRTRIINTQCGEEFFRHELPFDRSSMRQRMGEASCRRCLRKAWPCRQAGRSHTQAVVDTTVQEKNIAFR